MLAARIDRLPPEEKWLLQIAAAIGTDVPFPLLQARAELSTAIESYRTMEMTFRLLQAEAALAQVEP